jgi:hypothetical protein
MFLSKRHGWALGIAGVLALIAIAVLIEGRNQTRDLAFLDTAAVGDVYEVNLAKLSDPPKTKLMYSTARVTDVTGDVIQFQLAKRFCSQSGCLRPAIASKAIRSDAYYGDLKYISTKERLKQVRRNKGILHVYRGTQVITP